MIGQTISHYKILAKLGGGGMGVVYKAEDTKLKRLVALKFLPPDLTRDEEAQERFIHEAQAASALDHPNICTIYEIGEAEDGQLFIAMAYYEGETLKKKVGRDQLSVDSVIDLAIQIAQGLSKAHEKGIVHRDIKPANVFVTNDGIVKILDFGLAKLAGGIRLTKTGTTLGTPAYMSPEQVHGIDADHRSDIWSFGVVLYEMLIGQLPFRGEYQQAIIYSIENEAPQPVSDLREGVPPEVEAIVMKALAKKADERYQNVKDMLDALRQSGNQNFAAGRPTAEASHKSKRSVLYATVAGLVILLLAGIIYFRPSAEPVSQIDAIAVLPLTNLSGDPNQEYFADGMTEALISVLGQIEALRVISRTSVMQYKTAPKPLPEIGRELNVDAVVEGSVQSSGDQVEINVRLIEATTEKRLWSKNFKRELREVLTLQRQVALAIAGEIEAQVTPQEQARFGEAQAVDPDAYKHYIWGLSFWGKQDMESLQRAVKHYEQAIAIDPNFAQAYAALAVPYFIMEVVGLMPKEEAKFKARQAAAKALELDETLSEAHTAMAVIRENYDLDWAGAEEELRHAIKLNPGNREAHREYGLLLSRTGRTEEGLAEMMRALKLDPLSAVTNTAVAWAYVYNRRSDEAIEHCLRVLQLHPDFFAVQLNLGLAYLAKGRYEEAIAIFEMKAARAIIAPGSLGYLGSAYALSGKREKALKLLDEWQVRLERGDDTAVVIIAMIYTGLGEKDKALSMLERDSELREFSGLKALGYDPVFDPLRSEPRFQALLKKMGLGK